MDALIFIVSTLLDLYIMVVFLRLLMPLVRADFYNPLSRFVVQATNPVVAPLRRILPGYKGVDWATLVFLLVLEAATITAIFMMLSGGGLPPVLKLLQWTGARTLVSLVNLYFILIIVRVILSWVAPGGYHPVVAAIAPLTEPVMRPVRDLLPPLGGLDLSPLFVLIGLQAVKMLVIGPALPPALA